MPVFMIPGPMLIREETDRAPAGMVIGEAMSGEPSPGQGSRPRGLQWPGSRDFGGLFSWAQEGGRWVGGGGEDHCLSKGHGLEGSKKIEFMELNLFFQISGGLTSPTELRSKTVQREGRMESVQTQFSCILTIRSGSDSEPGHWSLTRRL